jgi:energy-coupling factor transport system ATP-binding protein
MDPLGRRMPVVSVRGLGCRFPDGTEALADVDLEVHPGEIVAVMGASGAGKSTLLKCLSLVVPALEPAAVRGERSLFGEPADGLAPASLAGRIGVVFQDFEAQLFSTNVALEIGFGLDQMGLAREEIRRRTSSALERVGLAGFASRDPATLSGGEKQRLAIAAIWALEPALVLLDEPTTDIDPLGKRAVFDLLRSFREAGAAVVVVEHEPEAAAIADRLLLLEHGRVRALGPSADLLRQVEVLAACGVRPRDIDRIAVALGVDGPLDLEAAESEIRRRGGVPAGARPRVVESPATASSRVLVQVEGLRHVYEDGDLALDGVSLTIHDGEFVALIGQNGSGKTTLAKEILGLLSPTTGRVLLDGRDTRHLTLSRTASVVGFVFQDPDHQLFCATVADEVAFGPLHLAIGRHEVEERVSRCLGLVGLGDRRGVDPFLLAKGERQRLAVAAVLALEPRILLLDEPTTGLDYREQRSLMNLLNELNLSGTTVIVITHAPWLVAEYAERAVLMAHGRILFDGSVAGLFASPGLLRAAAFEAPDATEIGARLGIAATSVDDLVTGLGLAPRVPA